MFFIHFVVDVFDSFLFTCFLAFSIVAVFFSYLFGFCFVPVAFVFIRFILVTF